MPRVDVVPKKVGTPATDDGTGPTEARILQTAERLFAERGPEAVSLRAITTEAGTNVASIHYHFGSKEGLLAALIQTRAAEVSARRAVLLELLEDAESFTARELARAFVLPVAEMAAAGGTSWVRLIAQILGNADPTRDLVIEGFTAQGRRFNRLAHRLHPDWTRSESQFRLGQAMRLVFTVLGDTDTVQAFQSLDDRRLSATQVADYLEDLVTAMLSDPRED
ncbi:TetR/AcrR family transcriptional regulator [Nocardioides dongkuii]|uniref:TetR/AcrR family transcriptional regulator n=1 Tax=Nocardioides dongkuii TaxID=2760089 RepID=UPI0018781DA8|nr:TetR/AcrR family transcriptional regulator [Nocardioides dongkuii]